MFRMISLIGLFVMASCTTIEIKEQDIFDVKRTIGPEYFKDKPQRLEEVQIASQDSLHLEGWFISHPSAKGTVLFYGGNGFLRETAHWIIRAITEQKMNLLIFNYRGYGNNAGEPTISGLKTDAMAAYHYLVNTRNIPAERIIIHGHSMGTLLGGYIAGQQPVGGLVMESPVTEVRYYTEQMMPALLKPFIEFEIDSNLLNDSNIDQISRITVPLLIVVGKEDRITPPAMARKLYHTAASPDKRLKVLTKGGHNDLPQRKDYQNILYSFYDRAIKRSLSQGASE